MIQKIKKLIPVPVKGLVISKFASKTDVEFEKYRGKKKIVVGLGGFYQNLGDMAITYAQKEFLKKNFPDYEIVLFPSTWTYSKIKALKSVCTDEDIITTVGGGNMDEAYPSLEDARRFIIKSFPNNRIVSFPQTINFSNTEYGKKRLKKTINTYSKHKNLTLFAREKISFERMKQYFPYNNICYSPDIVLSLNKVSPKLKRTGVIYCVRNDFESHISLNQKEKLLKEINLTFKNLTVTDTVNISIKQASMEEYEITLEKFWNELKSAEVVITDRLHCMIFCAITKTPCVVLPNSNQKIRGTYNEWLRDIDYIEFVDEFNSKKIVEKMSDIKKMNTENCNVVNLEGKYNELKKSIIGTF